MNKWIWYFNMNFMFLSGSSVLLLTVTLKEVMDGIKLCAESADFSVSSVFLPPICSSSYLLLLAA